MAFDYASIAVLSNELLAEFGQSLTITSRTAGEYDPATGTTSSSATSHEGYGAVLEYTARDVNGTLVQQGDKQLLLSPDLIAVPEVDDTVTIDQIDYTIKSVKTISPAGVPVLYDCNLRA